MAKVKQVVDAKGRVWTVQRIKDNIAKYDDQLIKVLVAIYMRQTRDERMIEQTTESNGVGFTGPDAKFLSSLAQQVQQGRKLSRKQLAAARKALPKYSEQVLRIIAGKV